MPELNVLSHDDGKWLTFPDQHASLHRMTLPDGNAGLLLRFGNSASSAKLREGALLAGFVEVTSGEAILRLQGGVTSSNLDAIAELLGEKSIKIIRGQMTDDGMIPENDPVCNEQIGRDKAYSDNKSLELLGTNHAGEDVFNHPVTGRVRKVHDDDGYRLVGETPEDHPTLYLRARSSDDLPRISMGMIRRAERGAISSSEFNRHLDAVLENYDPGHAVDRSRFIGEFKLLLLRQILGIVSEDSGSRASYHRAVQVQDNLSRLIEFEHDGTEGFVPSIKFLILIKRLVLDSDQAEFAGSWQLGMAVPSARCSQDADLQVLDMTGSSQQGLPESVLNCLGNRKRQGVSCIIISGHAESEAANSVRYEAGRAYILDIVAEFEPHLASGQHDGDHVTMFVFGTRRAKNEDSLPEAARRTFSLSAHEDFDRLHTEILRSRKEIRKWIQAQKEHKAELPFADLRAQRPYIPLSQATPSFTMIPKSLEGATAKALRRVSRHFDHEGGVDVAIARILGIETSRLGEVLTAEQVDAVAMYQVARSRNRAFLLADHTGIGKGRSLAVIAREHLQSGGRVIYFTENAEINVPDVWRDITAVGARKEAVPTIVVSRPVILEALDNDDGMLPGFGKPRTYETLTAAGRRKLFASCEWPEGSNLILTNYSQFRGKEASPGREWTRMAIDESVMIILDESQNALNPQSNTGAAIRDMIDRTGRNNVVFATATPMRNQFSAHLYHSLLPDSDQSRLDPLLSTHLHGGEIAQESFTTMLAEDGVFLRRDHDLSNIDFQVRLPDNHRMSAYREIMDRFSPMIESILECSLTIGDLIGENQGRVYRKLINEGFDPETAAAETTALSQYSHSPGGALSRLSRLLINAIKVEQVANEVLNELRENRKPLVTFHSTGNELFKELVESGVASEGEYVPGLTLADQIRRVAESIYRVRVAEESIDARTLGQDIADRSEAIEAMIAGLPSNLPASPLDALVERLEFHGLTTGEISGRQLVYRDGRILRRSGTGRKDVVDAFNEGTIDVLIYNMAGATGGSYHAAPEFGDQRPRSLVEMETPLDIIKYVQAQGRSNRYGQVARPRIVSVMTGLIPEMRILQQRNCKLRSMGASVDGNRSHPLLLDDIPDLLNIIGDRAAKQVLEINNDMARRLGFLSISHRDDTDIMGMAHDIDLNIGTSISTQSIANKVLSRSIVLPASEQARLINLIRYEFDALVEELDSKDSNPLRMKELPGTIEIRGKTLYSGIESMDESFDTSAFFAPLYLSTGIHQYTERPIGGDELQHMVSQSRIRDGAAGFSRMALSLQQNFPTYLQPYLRPGTTYAEAIENIEIQPYRFRQQHEKFSRFLYLLQNIKPGKVIHLDEHEHDDTTLRTIVRLVSPEPKYAALPQAYKIHTVSPGHTTTEVMSLGRLINQYHKIRFNTGLELGRNLRHIEEFSRQSRIEQTTPVQILTGNLLEAIELAKCNRLGSMSLYRDTKGKVNRGIIIRKKNLDLRILPTTIPTVQTAKSLVSLLCNDVLLANEARADRIVMWTGDRDNPDIYIRFDRRFHASNQQLNVEMYLPFPKYASRRRTRGQSRKLLGFYADKQDLHQTMWVTHYNPKQHGYGIRRYLFPHNREILNGFFECLKGTRIFTDGLFRDSVNKLNAEFEQCKSDNGLDIASTLLSGWSSDPRSTAESPMT